MKTSKIVICFILWLVAFFIFVLCISLQFPSLLKDVKITDWLSLVVNCVIAALAFCGFYYAKDWKESLTEKNALEEGIVLKYNALEEVNNSYVRFLPSTLKYLTPDYNTDGFFDDVTTEQFFNVLHDISSELDLARDSIYNTHASLDKIAFFGWGLRNDKFMEFSKIDSSLDDLYMLYFQLEKLINDFLSGMGAYFKNGSNFPYIKYSKVKVDVSDATNILNKFFSISQNRKELETIIDDMMEIRSLSLKSIDILMTRHKKIHDLIEPKM